MPSASATSPAVRPSQLAGSRAAAAVARVPNCDVSGLYVESSPVISGSDMFIMCELSDSGSQVVARVNLTTNKLVKTYLVSRFANRCRLAHSLGQDLVGGLDPGEGR